MYVTKFAFSLEYRIPLVPPNVDETVTSSGRAIRDRIFNSLFEIRQYCVTFFYISAIKGIVSIYLSFEVNEKEIRLIRESGSRKSTD